MSNTPNLKKFIGDAIFDLVNNGIGVELSNKKIFSDAFDEDNLIITVRTKDKEIIDWGSYFLHEYCHFKQWQGKRFSNNMYGEAGGDLDLWIKGEVELTKKQLNLLTNRIKRCEIDCEQRVVKLIGKHKLEIDKKRYIKCANAYVLSYNMIKEMRCWYKRGPQRVEEILNIMPARFLRRYDRTPKKYKELYMEYCL